MKKRTKANRQKLNNLLILLLLTAVLLVMSTYAWFTANRTVNIDSIDVKVSTSNGLQISANAIDWGTILTKEDIAGAIDNGYGGACNQLPIAMAPVSTTLSINGNRLEMFYGDVFADMDASSANYGKYMINSIKRPNGLTDETATANGITDRLQEQDSSKITTKGEYDKGYYIAFDIFIKSGNDAQDFYMSGNVNEVTPTGGKDELGNDIYQLVTTEKGIANAARVALLQGSNIESSADASAMQALATNKAAYMWEPNSDYHTTHGIENGIGLGWITSTSHVANSNNQPVIEYSGLNSEFTDDILLENATEATDSTKFKKVTPEWATKKAETKPSNKMPEYEAGVGIKAGVTKYRVYMWVEGQDIDCENFASGTYLQYNLSFSLDPYNP